MTFTQIGGLVALGLVLFGGFFLVSGVRIVRADRLRRRTWHAYPGEVVATASDGEQTRCQVRYRRADGTTALVWNRFTSSTLTDPVGRPVRVLENPADPHDAVVADGVVSGGTVGTVFAAVGSVLAAAGLVAGAVLVLVLVKTR